MIATAASLILLAICVPSTWAQANSKYCPTGSTYEDRCLAMPYPSAFLRDTNECTIVIEDKGARQNQVDSACSGLGKLSGFEGFPFRELNNEQIKEMESYFALKQGAGVYYGYNQVNPSGKKTNGAEGYICSFKDKCGCESSWNRFKDHCYRTFDYEVTHSDAADTCEEYDAKLVQIRDDEDNKFVALLAQKTFTRNSNNPEKIWGSLAVVDNEWKHFKTSNEAYDDKIRYMRWWADSKGTEPVTNPDNYKGQTIYIGNTNDKQNSKFGYWGTARQNDENRFICFKKLSKLR